ncbi:MAG: nucleotidyltransferase domain-containing protein [Cyanobacteria bacterium]|nr:nucleotidyltransferase domain-containing protein [Cyanobacteriota bacterium]
MATSSRPSSYHYVVDEPLLRTIAAEIQAAIPGAQVRLFGSRARGTERPCHSRFEETGDLCRKLAHHRVPIDLLLYSDAEVQERRQYIQHVVTEAYHNGRDLYAV